jgi:predicted metalloprotease with PDZ domain
MQINIDLRDLPRKLVHVEITLPLTPATEEDRTVPIWYPKWVPGSHGPGGPIANVAGLKIQDPQGNLLPWVRTPGEVYRFEVKVPGHTDEIRIFLRYITNQPTTTSFGHDCFGGSSIGMISPGSLLLVPETTDIDLQQITTRLHLPIGWKAATALKTVKRKNENSTIQSYQPVSLRTLVDSPIMCGRHYQTFDLVEEGRQDQIPAHTLHVFGDEASHADLNKEIVKKLQAMVTQAALLIGSHPFDRFDILLGVSNELPKNGLEHSRSTFNVLPPRALQSLSSWKGWDRLLIPHEYIHGWCGKYRRPAGMLTKDFHTAKDTELLWVYEGLTQYLGELIEARSGLMSPTEFRHRINVELRRAIHQQGRKWRTLADTAAASHILRDGSPSWSGLRRSQDYYMEGMLFWLEADALIRQNSDGAKSLDDFCQIFLGSTATSSHPRAFTRDDIVQDLRAVADLDWDSLIRRRVESFQEQYDPSVVSLLGYEFSLKRQTPNIPAATFRRQSGIDVLDSLGMVIGRDGNVQNLLIGSPADRARFGPTMKIIGVNGLKWSGPRLLEALVKSQDRRPINLLVEDGDELRTIQLHYYEGPRYWNLVRQQGEPDLLLKILEKK